MNRSYSHRLESAVHPAGVSGFTFLEVLVALCVILIALVPLIQLHITSIHLLDSTSRRAIATSVANGKLAEIAAQESPELGTARGRIEMDRGLTLHWTTTVSPAESPELAAAALLGIRHVQVEVVCEDGSQDSVVSMDTFVHIPVQSQGTESSE